MNNRYKTAIFAAAILACCFSSISANRYDTPTMGWSSWNTYRVDISDSLICSQADAMAEKGLRAVGYRYINIDDGYFGGRDSSGRLMVHPKRFPNGLRPVVEHIHRLGFKAGIYSDAGSNTCGSYWDKDTTGIGVGLYGHDRQDAELFFKTLKFDFIKVDFCGGDAEQNASRLDLDEKTRYTEISKAISATGRKDVRMNICRWTFPGTWVHDVATSWRISPDIRPKWESIKGIIERNKYLSAFATEGRFNDMDMLEIGRGLRPEEERTHFGMWCIMASPLLIGCDMTAIPESSLRLIKNKELIAINQDPLALQARIVRTENGVTLFVKDIEKLNGRKRAIALYNPTDKQQTFTVRPADVELDGKTEVRDLVNNTDMPPIQPDGQMTVIIAPHDTRLFSLKGRKALMRRVYEAECGWLQAFQTIANNVALGTAVFADDIRCSGGGKVSWLGNSDENYLEWRNVYVPKSGTYKLTIHCLKGKGDTMDISANGSKVGTSDMKGRYDSEGTAQTTVTVSLEKGRNSVRISNDEGWAPDIDYLEITK